MTWGEMIARNLFDMTNFLTTNFLNGILGILLMAIAFKLFDKYVFCYWDFKDAFEKDKVTNGGIVVAVLIFSLAYIISVAIF